MSAGRHSLLGGLVLFFLFSEFVSINLKHAAHVEDWFYYSVVKYVVLLADETYNPSFQCLNIYTAHFTLLHSGRLTSISYSCATVSHKLHESIKFLSSLSAA